MEERGSPRWLAVLAFLWIVDVSLAQHDPNCADNRVAMVHLFEWKWTDIARECEVFLGPRGYCGVQISPPTDHIISGVDRNEPYQSWWQRYQPVSYHLVSRSGNREQFIDMVERCNNVGVRIYVDAVINHMAGMGRSGVGIGGSPFDADEGSFPNVPYTMDNFNDCSDCSGCCCIDSWTDFRKVRNCRLLGLIDLDPKVPNTEDRIVEYMNDVIDIGVAGFRVDAAKHMWPEDLQSITNRLNNLNTRWFPSGSRPFMGLEVIDLNQQGEVNVHMYKHIGRVTEFRFCIKVSEAASALWDVEGIYNPGWGMVEPENAFVFVDNHDNQRGHGGGGNVVTHTDPRKYKIASAIALGYTYGHPRVMSSFFFEDSELGPPHNEDWSTADVIINEDGSCGNGWVCEHRWGPIAGMAGFAKAANGQPYIRKHLDGNEIAWSRGDRAFIAITNKGGMNMQLNTGLPAGEYCDVITGCPTDSGCSGGTVSVDGAGNAQISITNSQEPMVAIHVEARSGSGGCIDGGGPVPTYNPPSTTSPTTATSSTTTRSTAATSPATTGSTAPSTTPSTTTTREPGTGDWQRTVIYIKAWTSVGQDLFLRGGISHSRRQGCTDTASSSSCALPIEHRSLGSGSHYEKHTAWSQGDRHLDWYGEEAGQGRYNNWRAEGTPAVWTTNDPNNPAYQPDNQWGEHYWKIEFDMDCSTAENGWFEFKSFITMSGNGWEGDINQSTCGGTAGGTAPYPTNNHMARCGFFNRFELNSSECNIDQF